MARAPPYQNTYKMTASTDKFLVALCVSVATVTMMGCSSSSSTLVQTRERISASAGRLVLIGGQPTSLEEAISSLLDHVDKENRYSEILWLDDSKMLGMIERPFGGAADGTPYLKFKVGAFIMGSKQPHGRIIRLVVVGGRARVDRLSGSPYAESAKYDYTSFPFGSDKSFFPIGSQHTLLSIRKTASNTGIVGVEVFIGTAEEPSCHVCFDLKDKLSSWLQADVLQVRISQVPIFDDQDGLASPLVFLFSTFDPIAYWRAFGQLDDERTASTIYDFAKSQITCGKASPSSCVR
jgi:hypothetical protein